MHNGEKLMLSQNLEKTLREAYQLATTYKHEYVTLEHLLFSLLEDKEAISVLRIGMPMCTLHARRQTLHALFMCSCSLCDHIIYV